MNLQLPVGVEADRAGNIYLDSDATFTTTLTKFAPNRAVLGQVSIGGIQVGNLGRIARVPNSDDMFLLTQRGQLHLFGPRLRVTPYLNLGFLNFAVANDVFDVNTRRFRQLPLGAPNWGDIAAFWRRPNLLLYLYITGTTGAAGGFPFVLRLDLDFSQVQARASWRVVATSTGSTVGAVNQPRGVAVNPQGWVLTGLPFPVPFPDNGGFADSLVAFRTSFPERRTVAEVPRFVLRTNRTRTGLHDLASFGMASDAGGNFYVASGVVGSSLCGIGGSSALVVISPNPNVPNPRCHVLPSVLATSSDVAVSPVGRIPYLTLRNQVVRFPRLVR